MDHNDIVFPTVAATEVADSMIAKSRTGRHCENVLRSCTRYHCGSGMATSVQKETTDYNRDRLKGNVSPSEKSD